MAIPCIRAAKISPAARDRRVWPHLVLIAAIAVSRRPDAILHPQFWAEDGQVFYHDAYTTGLPALWSPLGGYFNTLSRLVAAFAVQFPLIAAPAIYAAFAAFFQLLPAALLLSPRLATALPSWPARLALAYFYAAIPNSYELNLNLTNAQWHLAMAAFLLVVATPPASHLGRIADTLLLTLSGLSGPFDIFLLPIAWLEVWQNGPSRRNALILTATSAVQLACLLTPHPDSAARLHIKLGATPGRFIDIVTIQILIGDLLGHRATARLYSLPLAHRQLFFATVFAFATFAVVLAFTIGPTIHRKAVFWASGLFTAALLTPLATATGNQWAEMTRPGVATRYYLFPGLVWFATWLILAASPWRPVRVAANAFLAAAVIGVALDWRYPPYDPTAFAAQAAAFAAATPGTAITFPENPPGWAMVLTKR